MVYVLSVCLSMNDGVSHIEDVHKYHHGTEETPRIAQEGRPQEEVGEAPWRVAQAQQQEGSQAPFVSQEEELQEGRRRGVDLCTRCPHLDPFDVS